MSLFSFDRTTKAPRPNRTPAVPPSGMRTPANTGSLPGAPQWSPNPERRNMRVRLAAQDVRAVFDNRVSCRVIDVSEGGMCLETERPLPCATGSLRFDQLGLAMPVRVAWSQLVGGPSGPRYRCGLQFLEPTFDQIRKLLDLAAA
jgi:hypothetical protein